MAERTDAQDRAGHLTWRLISFGLIVASLFTITIESVPEIRAERTAMFYWLERFFVVAFAIEYVIRLVNARPPWRYAFSFWGIIDLLAWLPALLFAQPSLVVLRAMRILRIFELLHLPAFQRALHRLAIAFKKTRESLILFAIMGLVLVYLSAVGVYLFEREAQPEVFRSIPDAMWWSMISLTSVGYGDMYPITLGGRLLTAAVLFIGLAIIAIPTGIITAALLAVDEETELEDKSKSRGDDIT